MEDHHTGLLIAVLIYFVVLTGCTVWAHRRLKRMEIDGVNNRLTAFYLGGQDFGPFLTACSVFSTLFSGYTVIGIPNEAYRTGWQALRWLPTVPTIVYGFFGAGLRLRKAANIRNHESPVDFITDRFQSQYLRYTVLVLQVLPSLIYLAAQVTSIKGSFNAMFGLGPDEAYPVVIIMFIILLFEWIGGLGAIFLTDVVQTFVMLCAFIAVPLVLATSFYGWKDLDPYTYPRPEFYQSPSRASQWQFWQFSFVNFAVFTLPHFMQRIYAAKNLRSLKWGYTSLLAGCYIAVPVGVFIGTVGVMILDGADVQSPYSAIIDQLFMLGGFPNVIGVIALTASLAAVMSTTDSLLIAVSHLVTADIVYPHRPTANPKSIVRAGRVVSFLVCLMALIIGLFWKGGLADMAKFQFPISLQAAPAFLIGLFSLNHKTDVHPWCIASSALIAVVYVLWFYFAYLKVKDSPLPIDAGITGFLLQCVLILSMEIVRRAFHLSPISPSIVKDLPSTCAMIFPNRPSWDIPSLQRFGAHTLTPQLLWKSMEGVNEPMANPWWAGFVFFSISMVAPFTAEGEPPIDVETGNFPTDYPPATYNGIPWWAMKILVSSIFPLGILLLSIWNMPNGFAVNKKKIEMEGIHPDLVELTLQEKGQRTCYDKINYPIHRRRCAIRAAMTDLGMDSKLKRVDDPSTSENRRLLCELVTSGDLLVEEEEEILNSSEESKSSHEGKADEY